MSLGQFNTYKVLSHLENLKAISEGQIVPPVTASIEPSSFCNFNCPHCNSREFRQKHQAVLSKEVLKRLPVELSLYGVKAVLFTGGGEPLSNPNLLETFRDYRRNGMSVGLITNGTMFRTVDDYYDVVGNCSFIRISLDAISEYCYNRMHGTSHGSRVVLYYMRELVKARRAVHRIDKCQIGVSYLLTHTNENEAWEAAKVVKEIGADYIQIKPIFNPRTEFYDEGLLSALDERVEQLRRQFESPEFRVYYFRNYFHAGLENYQRPYPVCLGHFLTANILSTGKLSICCQTINNDDLTFGDLNEQPFRQAWESIEHLKVASKINLKECKPCKFEEYNKMLWSMRAPPEHKDFI